MIEVFLWYSGGAFIGAMILHTFILYGPTQDKIVDREVYKSPFYEPEAMGLIDTVI